MNDQTLTRLVAVGDIMLGRGIRQAGFTDASELLASNLLEKLTGDIVTGNLECLVGSGGSPSPVSYSHFQGDPKFARPLVERFDVVTLANNHVGDFGDDAVEETLAWLDEIRVLHVGIGRSTEEAVEPALFETKGRKLAIFGATTVGSLLSNSRYILAAPGRALYQRAAPLVAKGYRCVLHLHAGGGDVCHPAPALRILMSEVRDAGFSIVFGHHPHVIQGFNQEADGTELYSLGDFLFDKLNDGRDQALVAYFSVGGKASEDSVEFDIVQRAPDLRLSLLTGEAKAAGLQRLDELSTMIRSGESDQLYIDWRGSKWQRLIQSVHRDFQAGGFYALRAKLGRVNSRKLCDLLIRR